MSAQRLLRSVVLGSSCEHTGWFKGRLSEETATGAEDLLKQFYSTTLIPTYTSNKNFILKYFRCRDGKRRETRIGMEARGYLYYPFLHSLYTVYMQHIMAHSGGMQEWVIQIPSIPILVSVLFPSLALHLKYF